VAASTLLSQASSDSEPSRYRIRLSGSQANILTTAGIDVSGTTGPGPHKKSSERDTHSAVSSSKQMHHQHGLFVPMQNMRQNVSEKVAQVRACARSIPHAAVLKLKAGDSYIARLTGKPDQPSFTIIEVAVDRQEPMVLQR